MSEMGLYQRMKLKGIDMSWYERGKKTIGEAIQLDDQECSNSSVYLMKEDGTVWTLDSKGGPYKQVRATGRTIKQPTYVCMRTKVAYGGLSDATAHEQCKAVTGGNQAGEGVSAQTANAD